MRNARFVSVLAVRLMAQRGPPLDRGRSGRADHSREGVRIRDIRCVAGVGFARSKLKGEARRNRGRLLSDLPCLDAVGLLRSGRVTDGPDGTDVELARIFGILDDRDVPLQDVAWQNTGTPSQSGNLRSSAASVAWEGNAPIVTSRG